MIPFAERLMIVARCWTISLIIRLCLPAGVPLLLVVDETLERRWGPKIKYKAKSGLLGGSRI